MGQLKPSVIFPPPEKDYDRRLQEALQSFFRQLIDLLNQGLRFSANHDAQLQSYTTNATPDTEDSIAHTLKRVPDGVILVKSNKTVSLYDGPTAWTATTVYLRANVASATVKVLIF